MVIGWDNSSGTVFLKRNTYNSIFFYGFSCFFQFLEVELDNWRQCSPFEQLASLISLSLAAENFTPWVNTEGRQKAESAEDTSFSVSHTTRGFLEVCQKSIKIIDVQLLVLQDIHPAVDKWCGESHDKSLKHRRKHPWFRCFSWRICNLTHSHVDLGWICEVLAIPRYSSGWNPMVGNMLG